MNLTWVAVAFAGGLVVLLVIGNSLVAFIATRPRLQARLFGQTNRAELQPEALGLGYEHVEYGDGLWGWWIPARRSTTNVVLVHGFGLSAEPIKFAPEPLLGFAATLGDLGFSSLVINLGYATGTHPYSGGGAEADDIVQAVDWLEQRHSAPVAVWGFSAGGHDALVAAAKDTRIMGVAVDSAFTHTGEIVQQQAARTLKAPRWLFVLTPLFLKAFGGRDLDVAAVWASSPRKPTLIIHGASDEAIDPSEAHRLQTITNGDIWIVPAAGHVDSYRVATEDYAAHASAFLRSFEAHA
ncbi:MAG: hypothetical protein QOI61_2090 [Actinomycetota bacterium]